MGYNTVTEKMLEGLSMGEELFYFEVPTCKIDYVEIPQIIKIIKKDDDTFFCPTYDLDRDKDKLLKLFSNENKSIIIARSELEAKQLFLSYYENYLESLREELNFLEEAIPNLKKTDFLKDL